MLLRDTTLLLRQTFSRTAIIQLSSNVDVVDKVMVRVVGYG